MNKNKTVCFCSLLMIDSCTERIEKRSYDRLDRVRQFGKEHRAYA